MVLGMTGFYGQAAVPAAVLESSIGIGSAPIQLQPMEESPVAMTPQLKIRIASYRLALV